MHPDRFLNREAQQEPTISDSEKAERLDALGIAIAAKRKEAVDARKTSGVEDVWMYCEEAYLGIDDANRSEFSAAKWAKPTSMQGPVSSSYNRTPDNRSTAFVRLTSRYVDGASAKLAEIILPIDDKAFSLKPSPVQDPQMPGQNPVAGIPVSAPPQPAGPPGAPPGQPPVPLTGAALAAQALGKVDDAAVDAAKKAEKRIYDWMVECNYPAEARKVIKDCARIGTGVLKAPFPEIRQSKAVKKVNGATALEVIKKLVPGMKWTDPWDFYPADGCGENIHDGDYCLEKDYLSPKSLKKLKGQPGYLDGQIDKVIEEGPGKAYIEASGRDQKAGSTNRYEVWYYYGEISKDELSITNAVGKEDVENETVSVIITLVNDTVIRALINPNEDGLFPYRVVPWSRRSGSWTGVGVAEQISMPQRMVNASTRALLNNAGLSSGPQIIIDQLGIVPADGSWNLSPNKIWYKTGESLAASVKDAFIAVTIPSVQAEMMAIIQYAMKLAEESSGIPLVTQGQTGPTTPQTFGQAELQDTNSHTWLRSIGSVYDDCITEPLVKDLYDWLLQDPDVPENEKGDFQIDAKGSTAMVERAIQEMVMQSLLQMSANPAFELDPAKLMVEFLRSKRIDPRSVKLSEEQIAAMNAQPPQPPLPIAVEQLKQQGAQELAKIDAQTEMQMLSAKFQGEMQQTAQEAAHEQQLLQSGGTAPHMASAQAQIAKERIRAESQQIVEASRAHAEAARADKEVLIAQQNGQFKLQELALQKEIALLKYSNDQKISLDSAKVQLAKSSMDNQTKKELAAAEIELAKSEGAHNRGLDLHKHTTSLVRDEMSTPTTP